MMADYTAILAGVTAVAGAIALTDAWLFRPKRRSLAGAGTDVREVRDPWLVGQARSLFPVLLLVLAFRSFVFEPFRIPSESMMPGLIDGDFILVSKSSYGVRLPLLDTQVIPVGDPQRGQVIVFRSPSDASVNLIKRLVGLPGDHVVVRNNRVILNGVPVPLSPAGNYTGDSGFKGAPLAKETFAGQSHIVMFATGRYVTDYDGVVPPGHYFFMGDNRNDSEDSRFPDVGFVPRQNLIGHAVRIWMNWQLPGWPDLHRVGMRIR